MAKQVSVGKRVFSFDVFSWRRLRNIRMELSSE